MTRNDFATALLVVLILAGPVHYGGVLPQGHLLIQLVSFAAATLAFASGRGAAALRHARVPLVAVVALSAFGGLQLLPLPDAWLRAVAPWNAAIYDEANRILSIFGREPATTRISIAPGSTATASLLFLAYAASFSAALIVGASRRRRRILVASLLASSAIHVFVATAMTGGGRERIRGAFVNPNHFAGYLQIAAAFAFAVIWLQLVKSRDRGAGVHDAGTRFQRQAIPIVLSVVLWGIIAAGIGATRSRGGVAAAIVATALLLALSVTQRLVRSRAMAVATTVAIVAGVVFVALAIGRAPLLRFLASDPRDLESSMRVELWRSSIDAFEQSPIVGSGLGTFRESFRHVQPATVRGLVEHAHNDLLQMLVTGGVIGWFLVMLAFGSALVILLQRLLSMRRREDSAVVLGGIGALAALMLHGLVEFNMSIPAIPATLATMLGVSWAAALASERDQG